MKKIMKIYVNANQISQPAVTVAQMKKPVKNKNKDIEHFARPHEVIFT